MQSGRSRQSIKVPPDYTPPYLPNVHLGVSLGYQTNQNLQEVILVNEDAKRGTLMTGATGTGKSTLGKRIGEDCSKQEGCCITMDFHTDLAEHNARAGALYQPDNTYYFDFSCLKHLPVMNLLDIPKDDLGFVGFVIQQSINLLKHNVFNQYASERFDGLARLPLKTLLHPAFPYPPSLLYIPAFYENSQFLTFVLTVINDKALSSEWSLTTRAHRCREGDDMVHWFLSRFDELLSDYILRFVFGSEKSSFDLKSLIKKKAKIIFNIPEATLGASVAEFIASYLVSIIRNAVMAERPYQSSEELPEVTLIIDEFQKCASADFALLLAEARKFNLKLFLMHQNLRQLVTYNTTTGLKDDSLLEAVLGNIGTFICFRTSSRDAHIFAEQFDIDAKRLMNIKRYRPLVRRLYDNELLPPIEVAVPNVAPIEDSSGVEAVRARMIEEGVLLPAGEVILKTTDNSKDSSLSKYTQKPDTKNNTPVAAADAALAHASKAQKGGGSKLIVPPMPSTKIATAPPKKPSYLPEWTYFDEWLENLELEQQKAAAARMPSQERFLQLLKEGEEKLAQEESHKASQQLGQTELLETLSADQDLLCIIEALEQAKQATDPEEDS